MPGPNAVGAAAFILFAAATFEGALAAVSQTTIDIINRDCAKCDAQFSSSLYDYQVGYGTTWKTSLAAAQYYCQQFSLVAQCYVDCLRGYDVTYLSVKKQQFTTFYPQMCDPVCYGTVVPWCYMKHVGQFRMELSCDSSRSAIKDTLRQCLIEELFAKQRCTGSCTPGQRKANFLFMQLQSQCLIPMNTLDYCFTWVQYCIENYYGNSGNDFVSYSNSTMIQDNRLSCSYYGNQFAHCMQRSVQGDVVLGWAPSLTTYRQPCAKYQVRVDFLEEIERTRLTNDVCNSSFGNLYDICAAYSIPISLTTVTALAPVDVHLTAPQLTTMAQTTVITATPESPPSTAPSSPATSTQPAVITTASGNQQPTGQSSPVMVIAQQASVPNQPQPEDQSTPPQEKNQQPPSAPISTLPIAQPSSRSPSEKSCTRGTTTQPITTTVQSTVKPVTTRRSGVLDFFNIPTTTPPPPTTRRPRVTVGPGGVLAFDVPTTPAAETEGTEASADPGDDGGDSQGAGTTVRITMPRRRIFGSAASRTASRPALLLVALVLSSAIARITAA